MFEHLPRADVVLPGGRTRPGRVHGMRQGPDGRWWVQVSVQVPAGAVRPVPGEDYDQVPREPQYMLQAARHDRPESRVLVLHHLGCWDADGELLPVESTSQAAGLLGFGDTQACPVCEPAPAQVLTVIARSAGTPEGPAPP